MGRKLGPVGLRTVLLLGAIVGCHKSVVQHKDPPDPLLITKKPVEGRPRSFESTATAQGETPAPPLPWNDPPAYAGKPDQPPGRRLPVVGVQAVPDAAGR
jgi:hypothetical protein